MFILLWGLIPRHSAAFRISNTYKKMVVNPPYYKFPYRTNLVNNCNAYKDTPPLCGGEVHLPDDGTGTSDEPSERFRKWQEKLETVGIELSWAFKYNGGSNPMGFNLPKTKMKEPIILELLKDSYESA